MIRYLEDRAARRTPEEASSEPSEFALALRKAAVYGEVNRELDGDIDALWARIAELERRLDERPD